MSNTTRRILGYVATGLLAVLCAYATMIAVVLLILSGGH